MKQKLRKGLLAVLAVIFIGSVGMLIHQGIQYKEGEETYAEAESLADLPDFSGLPAPAVTEDSGGGEDPAEPERPVYVDPYADALRKMDFTALREVNSDVLGWILIPGTVISYPLVQGTDNQYYLKHSWKKWNSAVGAIFLEYMNSPNLDDFNTIIYGHRMNNGSMFASLKNYKKQSYWAAHPCVYITDNGGSHKYDIFAAYEVSTQGTTYQLGFPSDASKQDFIDYCLDQSVISTGVTPTVHDRIVTLSTCTGNGHATRWVVQAVQKGVAPTEAASPSPEMEPSGEASGEPSAEAAEPGALEVLPGDAPADGAGDDGGEASLPEQEDVPADDLAPNDGGQTADSP